MKRRILGLLLVSVMSFSILSGCGSSSGMESSSSDSTDLAEAITGEGGFESKLGNYMTESVDMDEKSSEMLGTEEAANDTGETNVEVDTSRKIVYTSSISIETKHFDDDIESLGKLVEKSGGYFENTSLNGNSEDIGRYASYTARIPEDKYRAFMDSVGDIGVVTYCDESVDDITSNYVDVQARLKSLNTKLTRLQELEAKAETVEDLLAIEDRINDVQYQLENYTAQLRVYDNKIDYCTVTIDVDEVVTYSEVKKDTAFNRFAEAFSGSISGFINFLQGLVIAVIYALPYILVILVVLLIVLKITKKKRALMKEETAKRKSNTGFGSNYVGPLYEEKTKVVQEENKDITNSEK